MSTKARPRREGTAQEEFLFRLDRAVEMGRTYKVDPVIAAPHIAEVLAPKVAMRAMDRGDDDPDMDYIVAALIPKIEERIRKIDLEFQEELRRRRDEEGLPLGRWTGYSYNREVLDGITAEFVPSGNSDA